MITSFEPGINTDEEFIPLCAPYVSGNEWKYIKSCLDSNWVSSSGPFVDKFENDLASFIGVPYAVATTNGTSALHLALLALGVSFGDEVITSTLTFISPVNTIKYVGADPFLVDADIHTWQMDLRLLEDFLKKHCVRNSKDELINSKTGRRIKAILPVHILGGAVDIDLLTKISNDYSLPIIEDATESLGAKYNGQMVGSFGIISCFSFNGNKIITTGGGGMIVTSDKLIAKRCKYLSTQAKDNPLEYIHKSIGYNYRLSNIQAAMGAAQLENLENYINRKRAIASRYNDSFTDIYGVHLIHTNEKVFNTQWLYTILIDEEKIGISSRELIKRFYNSKIQTRPLWQPMHCSPAHKGAFVIGGAVSEQLNKKAISLPCSVNLEEDIQNKVIQKFIEFTR